jgi:hypothetical protein
LIGMLFSSALWRESFERLSAIEAKRLSCLTESPIDALNKTIAGGCGRGRAAHGRLRLRCVAQQSLDLGIERPVVDRFGVIGIIGRPKQDGRRSMSCEPLFGVEPWLSRSHNSIDGKEAGCSVIWVKLVPLPWIVGEHDIGPVRSNQ